MIPSKHPAKKLLDQLFKNRGYPQSKKELIQYGFHSIATPRRYHALVLKHTSCPKYVFKLYLNSNSGTKENFVRRIKGSRIITEYINNHHYHHLFKAPKKHLYCHKTRKGVEYYVLVAEDMRPVDGLKNRKFWKSRRVSEELLTALHSIINDLGLIDSMHVGNIPICKDGKIGFVDTEHYHKGPINFTLLEHSLSKKNKEVWLQLTTQ